MEERGEEKGKGKGRGWGREVRKELYNRWREKKGEGETYHIYQTGISSISQ